MDLRNRIRLVGYCGQAPQLRFDQQGQAVTTFRLGVDERRPESQEPNTKPNTLWFNVELWGRNAERACELVSKGAQVTVEGRLKVDEWTDRDGRARYTLVVANAEFMIHKDAARAAATNEPPA